MPAVSVSLDTSESQETCREVVVDPEVGARRAAISRSLTLGSSSSCRTRLTLTGGCGASTSSRGSLRTCQDTNGYGVRSTVSLESAALYSTVQ